MRIDIGAIIFDCDGTLVDSEEAGLDVLHRLVLAQGLDISREQVNRRFRGAPMAEGVAWIAERLGGRPPSFEAEFTSQVREATAERFRLGLNTIPGAFELLSRLQVPFCVATNGPREKVELTLGLVGLRHLFGERIFSAYEVGCAKPDPGLFLHAAKVLGIAPERCAVIEDSLPGIRAGLAAGMKVFALHPRDKTPAELCNKICFIENLFDLDKLLYGDSE
jgi:HAD superfamily hydrolase (TIGR01509 family)